MAAGNDKYCEVTAACIAVWNLVSVFLEYLLLRYIYNQYPDLARKAGQDGDNGKDEGNKENKGGWIKSR